MIPSTVLFVKENNVGHETHIRFTDAGLFVPLRPVESIHFQLIGLHIVNSLVRIKCERPAL
jgi:hypothetical protein